MAEIFKDIKGFENKYQISDKGNVKSLNYKNTNKEKILKLQNNKGYKYISLYDNGKERKFLIHRLVAEAFIPNPNNLPLVNHKDENKENNSVENLEWCTKQYNNCYGNALLKRSLIRRAKYGRKVACFDDNGNIIKQYNAVIDVKLDNYYDSEVIKCCKNKIKKYKGYHWKYID